ncbi:unnamed protein product [Symbiodinium pilosum]|uniref:Uncharacterized protein n=1 Tax=Symbiodinium pilosum TaxID=2952 RepID=A0A812XRS5_SYMPI|nr:unnamed protein product [Symbiodinium pilosum]
MEPGSTISQLQERVFEVLRYQRGWPVIGASSVRVLTDSGLQLLAAQSLDFAQEYAIQVETLDWQDMLDALNDVPEVAPLRHELIELSQELVEDSPDLTAGSTVEFGDAVRSIYKLVNRMRGPQPTRGDTDVNDRLAKLCSGILNLVCESPRNGRLLLERIEQEYGYLLEDD